MERFWKNWNKMENKITDPFVMSDFKAMSTFQIIWDKVRTTILIM